MEYTVCIPKESPLLSIVQTSIYEVIHIGDPKISNKIRVHMIEIPSSLNKIPTRQSSSVSLALHTCHTKHAGIVFYALHHNYVGLLCECCSNPVTIFGITHFTLNMATKSHNSLPAGQCKSMRSTHSSLLLHI